MSYLKSCCLRRTTTLLQSGLVTRGAASPNVAGIHVHVDDVTFDYSGDRQCLGGRLAVTSCLASGHRRATHDKAVAACV